MKVSTSGRSLAAATLVALATLACGGSSSGSANGGSSTPIKIGVIDPFHGANAVFGEDLFKANQLAVEAVNAKGGINGRKITLVRGDATTGDEGTQEATRLATQENVDLFLGTYTSPISTTASDTAARYKKLYWDTNASAQGLTDRGLQNFLRSGPTTYSMAVGATSVLTDVVAGKLGKSPSATKVYIEHEDQVYGTSAGDSENQLMKAKGFNVLAESAHSAAATDLTDSVLRAQRAAPDVLVFTGYVADTNRFLRKMQEVKFAPAATILVGVGDTNETLQAAGASYLEGILVVSYPRPELLNAAYAPGGQSFLQAFKARYNSDPVAPQTACAYVGTQMLLDALAKADSTDIAKVRKAVMTLDKPVGSYPNGFGVKFDDKGQNTRAQMVVVQWQGGKVVTVYPDKAKLSGTQIVGLGRPS